MLADGDGHTWTRKDRMLAQALHLHEQSLCPCGCGQPARQSQDERFEGWYTLETTVCYARQELDRHDEDATKERKRGELRWVSPGFEWGRQP